jgi:predicted AAA+ superfamily ATPase
MMPAPGKKASKMTELILYLATRTNQQATYSQLYREFVERRGWAKNTLNKYLSLLHQRRVITRSWLSYTDSLNRLRKFRVYRLNKDYFREAQ